ncbi:MAG: diaminopimelate decarboxylase [Proteobacteria bacterium]|nr:diaminopimelate decarboxylase [Pseudomonadota bacterium]
MDHFNYHQGELFAEKVSLKTIAERFGTPCYVYSRATLERHWWAFHDALGSHDKLICYAVKANSNLAVLNTFAKLGSGFDVVSLGELERVIAAQGDPHKIVFSGVGKQPIEIERALEVGIYCFNVESVAELERINETAVSRNKKAPIALRINPDVNPNTHPYISTGLKENKFGIETREAIALYQRAAKMPGVHIKGIACHIGSQLVTVDPFLEALDKVLDLVEELKASGIHIEHLDLGGGLGVRYKNENPPHPTEYAKKIVEKLNGQSIKIILEPGRAIAANAGILLTQVEYLKQNQGKHFAIVDAGMNDLLRPALYQAWHDIIPVIEKPTQETELYDIVGPVCETGDFLGKSLPLALSAGDLLAVRGAGAYGFVMSSNYNSRPRPPEIMVDNDQCYLIRPRETIKDLFSGETLIPV